MYTSTVTYENKPDTINFGVNTDHLGNVRAVVSDIRQPVDNDGDGETDEYQADIRAYYDYYDGVGMLMPGRMYQGDNYRFGAQGSEVETEIDGSRDHITTYYRNTNLKTMRWSSPDPKPNPSWSPYAMMSGNPVWFNDPLGDTVRTEGFSERKIKKELRKGLDIRKKDNPYYFDDNGNLQIDQNKYDALSEKKQIIIDNIQDVIESDILFTIKKSKETDVIPGGTKTVGDLGAACSPNVDPSTGRKDFTGKHGVTIYTTGKNLGTTDPSHIVLYHELGGHANYTYIGEQTRLSLMNQGGFTLIYENNIRNIIGLPHRPFGAGGHTAPHILPQPARSTPQPPLIDNSLEKGAIKLD